MTATQRALTPAERTELRRHIDHEHASRFRRILPNAYPISLLAFWATDRALHGVPHALLTITLAAVGVAIAWIRDRTWSANVEADLAACLVVVLRPREAPDGPQKVEVLPRAGLTWTELGRPASWRYVSGIPAPERHDSARG